MKLTLKEIAEFCGGKLFGDENIIVEGFFTDSRKASPTQMYVPICGENVDGHKFIGSVFESGCKATFSQQELIEPMGSYILVNNTIDALQATAEHYRENFSIPVIGITGSVGKTTTKEMVALALEAKLRIHKTAGNANSQIGLPITIMGIDNSHEGAVIEMGMSLPGEMARIAKVTKPTIGVMTNIGVSHIEFHGTRENITKEKLRLADFMEGGTLFVNGDDDLLSTLKDTEKYRVVTFGISENCAHRAKDITTSDGVTKFIYECGEEEFTVTVPAIGLHNVRNALVAIAVAKEVGLTTAEAISAIGRYTPPNMRQQIKVINGITVIDDSYNASPDSMFPALDILKSYNGRKIAVLADMLELGDYSEKGHREVGEYAKDIGADILVAIGSEARFIKNGFGEKNSYLFENNEKAWEFIKKELKDGDTVLVKGSRGMHTEIIVNNILNFC